MQHFINIPHFKNNKMYHFSSSRKQYFKFSIQCVKEPPFFIRRSFVRFGFEQQHGLVAEVHVEKGTGFMSDPRPVFSANNAMPRSGVFFVEMLLQFVGNLNIGNI